MPATPQVVGQRYRQGHSKEHGRKSMRPVGNLILPPAGSPAVKASLTAPPKKPPGLSKEHVKP